MVLKKSKYGYNRGSTCCHRCRNKNGKETGKIYKFMFGTGNNKENQIEANEVLAQHLPDGGMQHNMDYENIRETYSLNKRQRWTLSSGIIDVIDSGELEDLDFRLVMHERSGVPFRFAVYSPDSEIKASTLSYHDSKYTVHHMYPNAKRRVSSLTDLKLNCHRTHDVSTTDLTAANGTSKRSIKCHTRGIQRMRPPVPEQNYIHNWWQHGYHLTCRNIMEGNYHHIKVPEVRYEFHYPDVFNRYCKCPGFRGHKCQFPSSTEKTLKRWKTKGRRSKPCVQQYFKGIDYLEKRLYASAYIKELDADIDNDVPSNMNDDIFQNEEDSVAERRTVTFGDFCIGRNRSSSKQNRYLRSSKITAKASYCHHRKPYTVTGIPIGQYNGKGNITYIDPPVNLRKEEAELQQTVEASVNDFDDDTIVVSRPDMATLSWSDSDWEDQFCSCVIDKKSVHVMIGSHSDCDVPHSDGDVLVSRCDPQQLCMTIKTDTANARVLLWKRSGWSSGSKEADYWVKVQFENDVTLSEMTTDDLKSKLVEEKDAILSLNQIAAIAKQAAANMVSHRLEEREGVLPNGYLTTSIVDPSFDVKTVHEAYQTLLTEKDDISQSFELINTTDTSSEIGICETCLCGTDDPQADGCTLLPCKHYFCIDCWRRHITIRIKEGATSIPCQAFECKEFIDEVMVRTLASCDLTDQWMKRKKERMLESSQFWHWCPTASCTKVARVTTTSMRFSGDNVPVLCGCGRAWCFSCQSDVHWPATCDQYSNYRKRLSQYGHNEGGRYPAQSRVYYVDVKKCPQGNHPIEKNGGCPQMTCRCSYSFCWQCLRDRISHVDGVECSVNATSLITMSLDDIDSLRMHTTRFYKKCVEHRYKWKRTYSNRTIEHRVKICGNSTAYKMRHSKKKQVPSNLEELIDQSTNAEFTSGLVFVREVHMLLENVYVMLSHTARRIHQYRTVLEHIEFCTSRMEHILDQSWWREEDLHRVCRLRTAIEGRLRTLPYLATVIQHVIQADKKRGSRPLAASIINST